MRNKARNRQTMISCLDLYRAGFRVGPGFSFSLLVAALLSPLARSPRRPRFLRRRRCRGPRGGRRGTARARGAKGTAAKGERIEAAPREVRLRDEVDPRGGDLSVLTEKGYLHFYLHWRVATRRHLTSILRFAERYPFRKSGLPLTRQRCGHGGGGERPGKLRGCGRRRCRLLRRRRRGEQKVRRERGAKSPIVGGRGSVRLGSSSWGSRGGTS